MMVKLVDHLVQGLHIDIEKRKQETAARQKLETQLYKLLAELVDTERKYVRDLEKACDEYLPLAGKLTSSSSGVRGKFGQCDHSMSLERKKRRRKKRSVSETNLHQRNSSGGSSGGSSGSSRQSLSGGSRSSQGSSTNLSVSFVSEPEVSQRE